MTDMVGEEVPIQSASSLARARERDRLDEIAGWVGQGDAASVQQLIDFLSDESWRVRQAAADALARVTPKEIVLDAVLAAFQGRHRDLGLLNATLRTLKHIHLDVAPSLSKLLVDPEPDIRIYAAHALGEDGDPAVVPALLACLDDPDINVRCQVIESLGKLRSARGTDALIAIAEKRDFATAWAALEALGEIGDSRISARLLPFLADDGLVEAALPAVGKLGDEETIAPVVELLSQALLPPAQVCQALCTIYERYHSRHSKGAYIARLVRHLVNPAARQVLIDALENASPQEASFLAKTLGWLQHDAAAAALAKRVARTDSGPELDEAIARLGPTALPALEELLHGDDKAIAGRVIAIMGRIGDPGSVPTLVDVSADDDLAVTAIGALAMIGAADAYIPVSKLLGHPRAIVRQAAVAAIHSLAHPERSNDVRRWLGHADPLVRESAVKIACYLGCLESMDPVFELACDNNEQVRKALVENLPLVEDDRTEAMLAAAIASDTAQVRAAAAQAMANVSVFDARPMLRTALEDPDVWVRYHAAKSLAVLKRLNGVTLHALTRVVREDAAQQVRIAAVEALATAKTADVISFLAQAVSSEPAELAQAVLKAPGGMRELPTLPYLLEALESSVPETRLVAVAALGASGLPAAVEHLCRIANDDNPDLAAAAIEALGNLDCEEAVTELVEFSRLPRWR
jgi:HEAT repeat protein